MSSRSAEWSDWTFPFIVMPLLFINLWYPAFLRGHFLKQTGRKYDNITPRVGNALPEEADPDGRIAKCTGAHNNGFEFFPLYCVAIIVAFQRLVPVNEVKVVAAICLATRVLYNPLYIWGSTPTVAGLRSLTWVVGIGSTLYLLFRAATIGEPT